MTKFPLYFANIGRQRESRSDFASNPVAEFRGSKIMSRLTYFYDRIRDLILDPQVPLYQARRLYDCHSSRGSWIARSFYGAATTLWSARSKKTTWTW
jgi:hypothetical protein